MPTHWVSLNCLGPGESQGALFVALPCAHSELTGELNWDWTEKAQGSGTEVHKHKLTLMWLRTIPVSLKNMKFVGEKEQRPGLLASGNWSNPFIYHIHDSGQSGRNPTEHVAGQMGECKIYKNTANMSLETWVGWNGLYFVRKKMVNTKFQNPVKSCVMGQVVHDAWRLTLFFTGKCLSKANSMTLANCPHPRGHLVISLEMFK